MVDVDVQVTSKITMICRAGPRGHGQRDMQETPDPFITHMKNPLKSGLGKKVIISLLFST